MPILMCTVFLACFNYLVYVVCLCIYLFVDNNFHWQFKFQMPFCLATTVEKKTLQLFSINDWWPQSTRCCLQSDRYWTNTNTDICWFSCIGQYFFAFRDIKHKQISHTFIACSHLFTRLCFASLLWSTGCYVCAAKGKFQSRNTNQLCVECPLVA